MKKSKFTNAFDGLNPPEELKEKIRIQKTQQSLEKEQKRRASVANKAPLSKKSILVRVVAAATAFVLMLGIITPFLPAWKKGGNSDINGGGNTQTGSEENNGNTDVESPILNAATFLTPATITREEIIERLKSKGDDGADEGEGGGDKGDGDYTENNHVIDGEASSKDPLPPSDPSAPAEGDSGSDSDDDYATTNVQQEGVDEGDIIKVDNNYIYNLTRSGLIIVSIAGQMNVTFKEEFENFYPDEMFIFGNKLIVIGGEYSCLDYGYTDDYDMGCELIPYWGYRTCTKIIVYQLNDRVNVERLKEYRVSGYFITSRLINNKLIVAVNHSVYRNNEKSYFPTVNGQEINVNNIYWYNTNDNYYNSYYYTVLVSLNLNSLTFDFAAHLGLNGVTYFSKDYVYFFNTVYDYNRFYTGGDLWYNYEYAYRTLIVKISLSSLKFAASQKIDGQVYDRYWADEYQNNLRVVSYCYSYKYENNWWETKRCTKVSVLDDGLNLIGKIDDIAPNENIYSVRFNKTQGSIVTFLQIDPLFKLDLSDPTDPKISSGLKEPGVSDYLQYLSDDVILGLGRNLGVNGGMKISLYDNTGENPVNINTIEIGTGYAYSEALYEPKAILNDPARNMFSFAVTMSNYSGNLWLEEQGLMVFEYNLNAKENKDKLIYKGLLTNIDSAKHYNNWNDYYYDYYSYVKRGARIGNKIYTISDRYIASYDINTLELIQRLELHVDPCHFTHRWANWAGTYATCTTDGVRTRYCLNDPSHTETIEQRAYGHSWNSWSWEWKRYQTTAQTAPANETRSCWRCNKTETHDIIDVDGLILSLNDDGTSYIVRTFFGFDAEVVIPASHNGLPVSAIDDNAFVGLNINIKSVTIPNSVITIGYGAFYDCTKLEQVLFEKDSRLEYIGYYAFSYCISLNTITLPKGLTYISSELFGNCTALETVFFEKDSQLQYISSYAFYYCQSLKSIELPQSLMYIGYSAFYNCSGLERIIIPSKVTAIYNSAFSSCSNLKSVYIPASVTYIDSAAFSYTPSLESLTVESGNPVYKSEKNCIITTATNTLFKGCNTSIIPDYVTSIGAYAFHGSSIKTIIVPKNVKVIESSAFANSLLESITISKNVEHIYSYAFYNCKNLKTVIFENGTILKTIGHYAFAYCTGIESIDIPESVVGVGYTAFYGWTAEQTINVSESAEWYNSTWLAIITMYLQLIK